MFMQQPAEAISAFHYDRFGAGPRFNRRATVGRPQTQATMKPTAVVVIDENG